MKNDKISCDKNEISGTSDSRRFKKSVRFQIYDARNMSTLTEMRYGFNVKLDEISENLNRSISPPKLTNKQLHAKYLKKVTFLYSKLEKIKNDHDLWILNMS